MSTVARETHAAPDEGQTSAVARETGSATPTGLLARLLILPIRGYQRLLSPLLGQRCRYYPTCSSYAVEALRELGPVRGSIVAAWRILRCNPFSNGGLDPLSARTIFRDHGHRDQAPHPAHHLHGGAR